jgi:phosphoenolpyruvate carboxylase
VRSAGRHEQLKLTKLTESEDIEAYLTTFERIMGVYGMEEAFQLAPLLTGKAQQAYAAVSADEAHNYVRIKEAVLRRYNISDEMYRQRFRSIQRREGEAYAELAICLRDWLNKWTAECKTVDEIREKLVVEQLLNTMPTDLQIWVGERWTTELSAARREEEDEKERARLDKQSSAVPNPLEEEQQELLNNENLIPGSNNYFSSDLFQGGTSTSSEVA